MLKKIASTITAKAKYAVESKVSEITDIIEIQQYVIKVMSKMEKGQQLWDWSKGYWAKHDEESRIVPLADRKAYMKPGKSFKKGKVYLVGSMFQAEYSLGATVGDIGTVYNLEHLNQPAQYAIAKDKDTVMLFNWQ
jgi:hypothetical protein